MDAAAAAADAFASFADLPTTTASVGALDQIPTDLEAHDKAAMDDLCRQGQLLKYANTASEIKWNDLGTKDGCSMAYSKRKDTPMYTFRGDLTVEGKGVDDADLFTVLHEAMTDPDNQKVMDEMCMGTHVKKQLDPHHGIYYATFRMPPLIQNRDFVWLNSDYMPRDGLYIGIGRSVTTDLVPEDPSYVRGVINSSGYVMQRLTPTKVRITYIVNGDPKGWLLAWVVNLVSRQQAQNPLVIKQHLELWQRQYAEKKKAGTLRH